MSYNWSDQQEAIFDEIMTPSTDVLTIAATAGSAKSSSLVEAIKRYKNVYTDATVQYLVFGSVAAAEARAEFGKLAYVTTIHALAHSYTVKPYGLGTVKPFLTWRDIPKSIKRPFGADYKMTQHIEKYCISKHLTFDDYVDTLDDYDVRLSAPIKAILNLMSKGNMPVTHSFYLKMFHILVMNDKIQLPSVDRLLFDEVQDSSSIALDILGKIGAVQKVLVGDENQMIFNFLDLENGFERYPNSKVLNLSKSFRVDKSYAPLIQKFMRRYLEPEGVFEGMEYEPNQKIKTTAYLARNNNSLIAKMIELNKANKPYKLSTSAKIKQMFALPLFLIYAKPNRIEKNSDLKHYQADLDAYGKLPKSEQIKTTKFAYLLAANNNEPKLKSAMTMISKFGADDIINASKQAAIHQKTDCDFSLFSAHVSKGITRDMIILDPDITKIVNELALVDHSELTSEERAEMALVFVAITRHRHKLVGADFLYD